jgi:succinate-semialdehyde dehydrogenase/glutarate-semialdehyde dehydrogenase
MTERGEHLARVMTTEQGKPLKAARNEVQYGADFLPRCDPGLRRAGA